MPAIAQLVFGIASLQKEARFLVAFLVQIMKQGRIGIARQLFGQFVQPVKQRHEIWLGIGGGHGLDRVFQLNQRIQQIAFQRIFHKQILSFARAMTSVFSARCLAPGADWFSVTECLKCPKLKFWPAI